MPADEEVLLRDWFRRHQRPGFEAVDEINRDIPDDLWVKCSSCGELLYQRELDNNQLVCTKCSNHFRLRATTRIEYLVDKGSFQEKFSDLRPADPLRFSSNGQSYREYLAKTQQKTGMDEAVLAGTATINSDPVVLTVSDFRFIGATMGSVYGEKLVRSVQLALEQRLPVLTISASGGARMHEGVIALMQMAKTTAAFAELGRAGLPHISLLTDPCLGGVTASYATSADVILAEPGALVGFAGPRVIEQITRQKLPSGFRTAEWCVAHGLIDQVVSRRELPHVIGDFIAILTGGNRGARANCLGKSTDSERSVETQNA